MLNLFQLLSNWVNKGGYSFILTTLFRSVLAALYFPGCTTSKNAVRCLSRWIKDCNPLTKELVPTGYMPYNHRYLTMKQYKIITKHLGDPYEY